MSNNENKEIIRTEKALVAEVKNLIEKSRQNVAVAVNAELSMLYWHIGKRINEVVLKNKRAAYGKQIISALSAQLTSEYGKGWSEKQLRHCLRAAETFPDEETFLIKPTAALHSRDFPVPALQRTIGLRHGQH